MFLDALCVIAELIAVGQGRVGTAIAGHQRAGQPHQRRLQPRIGQRLLGSAEKIVMLVACVGGHGASLWNLGLPRTIRSRLTAEGGILCPGPFSCNRIAPCYSATRARLASPRACWPPS